MADYITPLPGLLAHTLETAINHVLQLDAESPARVRQLEGKLLQVNLEGLSIALFFTFRHGVVRVRLDGEGTPDTVISGTPVALFSMAEPEDADWGLPKSNLPRKWAKHIKSNPSRNWIPPGRMRGIPSKELAT